MKIEKCPLCHEDPFIVQPDPTGTRIKIWCGCFGNPGCGQISVWADKETVELSKEAAIIAWNRAIADLISMFAKV